MAFNLSPMARRRLRNFKANRRGYISLWIFLVLFVLSVPAEFIANDKPLIVKFDGEYYFPVVSSHAETEFGGEFETEADYRDPFVQELIEEKGWMLWPAVPYDHQTINYDLPTPAPPPGVRVGHAADAEEAHQHHHQQAEEASAGRVLEGRFVHIGPGRRRERHYFIQGVSSRLHWSHTRG